jgi:GNAT superfamily N-acetyltransferase
MDEHLRFELHGGEAARSMLDELARVFAIVYAAPPYSVTDEDVRLFVEEFGPESRTEGFALATAREGSTLAGFTFGFPLPPDTSWWSRLLTPLPPEMTREWPGRSFAVIEMGVRPEHRRRRVGSRLHDLLLSGRPEERATLNADPEAAPAQAAYRRWGWEKVAQIRNPIPGDPIYDRMVKRLR